MASRVAGPIMPSREAGPTMASREAGPIMPRKEVTTRSQGAVMVEMEMEMEPPYSLGSRKEPEPRKWSIKEN